MLYEGLSISVTVVAENKEILISAQLFNVFLFAQFLVRNSNVSCSEKFWVIKTDYSRNRDVGKFLYDSHKPVARS